MRALGPRLVSRNGARGPTPPQSGLANLSGLTASPVTAILCGSRELALSKGCGVDGKSGCRTQAAAPGGVFFLGLQARNSVSLSNHHCIAGRQLWRCAFFPSFFFFLFLSFDFPTLCVSPPFLSLLLAVDSALTWGNGWLAFHLGTDSVANFRLLRTAYAGGAGS